MLTNPIKIGTRGSPLALAQAMETRSRLIEVHDLHESDFEILPIKTSGDRIQDMALSQFGGKGLFTKEIELALLEGTIDFGVHSSKDMPTSLPDGLGIVCYLPRGDVRDAFVSNSAGTLMDLPEKSVIGSASLRRQALVKHLRPDLEVKLLRGNVQTRLQKIEEGQYDATILSMAGLTRLGMENAATSIFETDSFLPAVGQGAICIEAMMDNNSVAELLEPINDRKTADCLTVERTFLAMLEGSCRTPIAGLARTSGDRIAFKGQVLSPDGIQSEKTTRHGTIADPVSLGREAGEELLNAAGPELMNSWKA